MRFVKDKSSQRFWLAKAKLYILALAIMTRTPAPGKTTVTTKKAPVVKKRTMPVTFDHPAFTRMAIAGEALAAHFSPMVCINLLTSHSIR